MIGIIWNVPKSSIKFVNTIAIKYTNMRTISQKAIEACKGNYKAIGLLMGAFNKHQQTIERWLEKGDVILTTPNAVAKIQEGTGLSEEEILEESTEPVKG